MTIDEIIAHFETEFAPVRNKFEIIRVLKGKSFDEATIRSAKHELNGIDIVWHPGVYVFYGDSKAWRVGRHFENSRKRVLEHIADNTQTDKGEIQIAHLRNIADAEIILFNVIDPKKDYHWVAAVEVFLENNLKPCIPAQRQG